MIETLYRVRIDFDIPSSMPSERKEEFWNAVVKEADPGGIAEHLLTDHANMYVEAVFDSYAVARMFEKEVFFICCDFKVDIIK